MSTIDPTDAETTVSREWTVQGASNGRVRLFGAWTTDRAVAVERLDHYRALAGPSVTYRLAVRTTTVTTGVDDDA